MERGSIARSGDEILLLTEVAGHAFGPQDIPNAGQAFLGIVVLADDDLVVQYILIVEGLPVGDHGQCCQDDQGRPMRPQETGDPDKGRAGIGF